MHRTVAIAFTSGSRCWDAGVLKADNLKTFNANGPIYWMNGGTKLTKNCDEITSAQAV